MTTDIALLLLSVVFAASVQTVAGFGFSLIIMPLAVLALGLRTASPLVALVSLTLAVINAYRNRRAVDLKELRSLVLVAALGVPIGLWLLANVDEHVVKGVLGVALIGYGAFNLLRPHGLPPIHARWGYPAGFIGGCLAGAYNVPGPPLVLYGSMRRWPPDTFRAVLQSLFVFTNIFTITGHVLAHRMTVDVLSLFALAVPAFATGAWAGARLHPHLSPVRARQVINALLIVLGVSLLR